MEIFSFGERLMIYRKRAGLSKKRTCQKSRDKCFDTYQV